MSTTVWIYQKFERFFIFLFAQGSTNIVIPSKCSERQVMCVGTEKTAAEIKANENAFAIFMVAMMLKYGPEVLKELQVEQKKSAK